MYIIKDFLNRIWLSVFYISITYKNGISSLRFNPHCGVYNNLFCVSSPRCNNFTIKSNFTARLFENIHQRHHHLYLRLYLDWRCFYPINAPFKKLKRCKTIKHAMYILIPVVL